MTFAVFGSSYVVRLEEYVRTFPGYLADEDIQFYGVSGMSTTNKLQPEMRRMLKTNPKYVFLNVGGNDINSTCIPQTIVANIVNVVKQMKDAGVEEVFVASIVERGRFKPWTHCDQSMFNKIRRSVNEKLSKIFRGHYVDVGKKLRYPKHYDRDLIHPGWEEGGLWQLRQAVYRCYCQTKK